MDKTIEDRFFKAFEMGGVVHTCIDWMREKYDLGYMPHKPDYELKGKWEHYYNEILPKQIADETEAFDFSVIDSGRTAKIIEEIEANLKECKDDAERERYLYTLLIPFECIAKVFHPTAEIERLKTAIDECNQDKIFWDKTQDFIDANTGEKIDAKKQSEACVSMAKTYQDGIDRIYHINRQFCEILGTQVHDKGTVEYYCFRWVGSASQYAHRLDALLLTYGIDLMHLQKKSGMYLKGHRSITDVDYYLGSIELAQHYINALPNHTEPQQSNITLPEELNSDTAIKYFSRAVNAGYMEKTDTGYKWNQTKARLGYFCLKAYDTPRPIAALERYFNAGRLSAHITQASNDAKRKDVITWRGELDTEIFTD
ncbi:MAG: hypothetical protein RR273_00980 [Oscillospiraceae bacterium]